MFHGNAGNVHDRKHQISYLHKVFGGDVFLWEYPGFGKLLKEGKPSCASINARAQDMLKHWNQHYSRINLYGESIGCVVASHLATRFKINRVVLQSGPASINHMLHHLTNHWLGNMQRILFHLPKQLNLQFGTTMLTFAKYMEPIWTEAGN